MVTVHSGDAFIVEQAGNGAMVRMHRRSTTGAWGRTLFLQGDDAAEFIERRDQLEELNPYMATEDIYQKLWWNFEDASVVDQDD